MFFDSVRMESLTENVRCRTCLNSRPSVIKDIFSGNEPIYHLLEAITGLKIKKSDKFPSSMCDECVNQLNLVWRFRRKCEESELALQKLEINISDENEIKDEIFNDNSENDQDKNDKIKDIDNDDRIHDSDENNKTNVETITTVDRTKKQQRRTNNKTGLKSKSFSIIKKENKHDLNEKSRTSNSGENNMKKEKTRKNMCAICGKTFIFYGNLLDHERIHSGVKPFECNICKQRFAQSGHLLVHKRTHSGFKPYQCDICSRFFTVSHSLKKHMRTHTGEKPYSCIICSKSFSTSYHLSNHSNSKVHKKSL